MTLQIPDATTEAVVVGLRRLGYGDPFLERNYSFPDWFAGGKPIRTLEVAAFGQTPISYESACIGVARANGLRETALVDAFRGFGAPLLLEIDKDEVREWAVSRLSSQHSLIGRHRVHELQSVFADRAKDWTRDSLMRAKNIGSFHWSEQLGLFSGLIPELEGQIQEKLDPLLRQALASTREAYRASSGKKADPQDLFRLIFWMLTAKVFHDRQVAGFVSLKGDPDQALGAVARQYQRREQALLNATARQVAAAYVWRDLDFRNLSVEVLAHIWAKTLVDPATRKRLGIHRTPRSIVRYVVEQIPFSTADENRIVFEPCSGSASFLIGVLNYLRPSLHLASAQERHRYFVNHLAGMEVDPFGVEISALALTLADFPNPNGWNIQHADVFSSNAMAPLLRQSAAVLCNPPFERLTDEDRTRYRATESKKPAELVLRVLNDLHPSGVLGLVLPYNFVDGRSYARVRKLIADRFASVQITVLPERSFEEAETDVALLVATEPYLHSRTRVVLRRVKDTPSAWERFDREHEVSSDDTEAISSERAITGFVLAELPDVWTALSNHRTLGDVAEISRGLEWKSKPNRNVRPTEADGFIPGIPPRSTFGAFLVPPTAYLNANPREQRRNSYRKPWARPKAIVPKARVSRGRWRIVAFPDSEGLACFQSCYGVWAKTNEFDEFLLAAVLNSPLANAFVATREGNRDVTKETLELMPVPLFSPTQRQAIRDLVLRYRAAAGALALDHEREDPELLLKMIDATVLDAYHLAPRIERRLLDFFNYQPPRRVGHAFSNYFPESLDVYVSLSEFLSPRFAVATVGELVKTLGVR